MNSFARLVGLVLCFGSFFLPAFAQQPSGASFPDFLIDHNHDGVIDSKDLLNLIRRWGIRGIVTPTATHTSAPPDTPTATPSASPTETPTRSSTHTPTFSETPTETDTGTPTDTPTPSPTEAPTIQNVVTVTLFHMHFIRIPAGSFMMGSSEAERGRRTREGPQHQVTISYDFYMGQTEVTQAQWAAVMGSIPSNLRGVGPRGVGPNYPVYDVSWDDCQSFIAALNSLGQGTFRLPSEAEWEYACRAGTTTRFYYGNSLGCADDCSNCEAEAPIIIGKRLPRGNGDYPEEFDPPKGIGLPFNFEREDFMWYCWNSGDLTHPVRTLRPNNFGLYDMAGNVWEWCQDTYHNDYIGAVTDGSAWEFGGGPERVLRGGSWSSTAVDCRSAHRGSDSPTERNTVFGFRLVRNAE